MKWLRRLALCVMAIGLFFWLGFEDRSLSSIIVVAALVAFALGLEGLGRWTEKRPVAGTVWLLRSVLIGIIAGAMVGPIAALLALVKISLHRHAMQEFDLSSMRMILGQSLTWIAAGGLFGAAGGFLKLSRKG